VVYDRLIPKGLLEYVNPKAELFYVGKSPGYHSMTQDEINRLLLELTEKYNIIVRLKGGDPLTFGRGEEECEYLVTRKVDCEIVPGISSYLAATAKYGIPLAGRNYASSFTVATGHLAENTGRKLDYSKLAETTGTLVLLMAASNAQKILEQVVKVKGRNEYGLIIQGLGEAGETVICGRLGDLVERGRDPVRNPAVIIIGKSVESGVKLGRIRCM
ncbi:MAG: uroporphyrinogen-III C-methyltransferase, partial [Desulfurococcales archaeon]|nr:uroporphyrinogen-III C-methyltransferase [Desulfurococcales archaeon]